ncbi:unnamed protein product [Dovyalis caffra]|uniref:Uncharacterized protein n=1 Tax=Dovyalis caffra TaxID=77055 RepID=A0AAV1RAV0_9ROSI|nr:unnamed protein product [Dovyalis caffra]
MEVETEACNSVPTDSESGANSESCKRRKILTEGEEHSDAASCIPDTLRVKLQESKYGSVTKEIEKLLVRRSQMYVTALSLSNPRMMKNSEIPFMDFNVEKERGKELCKQITHLAPIEIIDSDDDEHEYKSHSCFAAFDKSVVIIDSDDEDHENNQMPSHLHKKVLMNEPANKFPEKDFTIQLDDNPIQANSYQEVKVENEARDSPSNRETQKDRGPPVSTDNNTETKENEEFEDLAGEVECLLDNCNILIDKDPYGRTDNKVEARESEEVKVTMDEVECLPHNNIHMEKGSYGCPDNNIEETMESEEVKALGGEVDCLVDKSDIQIDKSLHVGIDKNIQARKCEEEVGCLAAECNTQMDKSAYDAVSGMLIKEDNHPTDLEDDGLGDMWKEMAFALECSKDFSANPSTDELTEKDREECDHLFVLRDDIGDVCRICGIIQRSIDTIFEFKYCKARRSTRSYAYESKNIKDKDSADLTQLGVKLSENILMETEIFAHPKHRKEMKAHQVEGFKFLCNNLLTDDPGGCILAHAPGSGKTFMVISFIQSFLAKNPDARPLVILPKGILATWKKEFTTWQVEDIPLYDFYSSKADNRSQQLDVLEKWVKQRSFLFLGYKQFSVIVSDNVDNKVAADCKDILLKVPTILILDEGHLPRNEETEVLQSLLQVQTPLKVVLSGTLYQNHVKEVFNILNLVRPKFLKFKTSREIVNRIMSRVQILKARSHWRTDTDSAFFDLVEYMLQNDEDLKTRKAVIQDLREMTGKVLHFYKGDFLDELPGLVDFTVLLNLSARQKNEVLQLRNLNKFKQTSVGSALYLHPQLKYFSEKYPATGERGSAVDDNIDTMLEQLDIKEGAKVKFFLNFLDLCESAGEKLLVFSQYILPLKLLERLAAKRKGWSPGKELFTITGNSNAETRERDVECFNGSPDAKVFFGSIKACGEGISLVGASRIIILDVHLNPSVTLQAIGRAFRPGQKKKVYVYRLVAADSPEEQDYLTCCRKELISKMWFEWNEYCGDQEFEVKAVDVNECDDVFLESPWLREDLKVLYRRPVFFCSEKL